MDSAAERFLLIASHTTSTYFDIRTYHTLKSNYFVINNGFFL